MSPKPPKDSRITKGKLGESYAQTYLTQNGIRIIERNWRCRLGEMDIIAEHDDEIVFVEVRSRTNSYFGTAAESINQRKQQRVRQVAQVYLSANQLYHRRIRFDVITVLLAKDGTLVEIDHLPGAF